MEYFHALAEDDDDGDSLGRLTGIRNPRDTTIQLVISVALGLGAFLIFCVLRPRWTGLYAARKKQKNVATTLPELPDSMFGWIIPLWKITDQQILASAGLDAYVFLAFFRLAMKFLFFTLCCALIIIKPVHDAYPDVVDTAPGNKTHHNDTVPPDTGMRRSFDVQMASHNQTLPFVDFERDYLWMYVVFAYLFSGIGIYLVISETRRIIEVRQEYLGTQTTVTDRTIRLSGIPVELRDEGKIKDFIESLDIGKVQSIMLCRQWKELDMAIDARMAVLRRLEEAYTIYQGAKTVQRSLESLPIVQPPPPLQSVEETSEEAQEESMGLLGANGSVHTEAPARARPKTTIRYGRFKFQSKRVDAIDYYEEQLRQADQRVEQLRQQDFDPTPLAFVTMDSVAACQTAIQAVLDPSPLQLIASQSPAPSDVIWQNTYLSRRSRMIRSWSVTIFIGLLTIFWFFFLVPVAGLLKADTIGRVLPQLGHFLKQHENIRSLVQTQMTTLLVSLLTVLVPYLYYWLSWYQGMTSHGDIELSAISKNFFFTFFNFFILFTIMGTAATAYDIFERFGDALRDFRHYAYTLAHALSGLMTFYVNFIILQGIGLFPFRLLEVGSVSLYPIYRMGAKTPRDYAELVQPPTFSYGFYLPTALLVFIICMVYSVLRSSWQVLLAGFAYFSLGHFVYKYQLLYAMDHQQQSTGRAWGMICDRIFVGMVFFQLTTAGQLILQQAVIRSVLMVPLFMGTIWISIAFGQTYKPLMKYIALRSVQRAEPYTDALSPESASVVSSTDLAPERQIWADGGGPHQRYRTETRMRYDQVNDDSFEVGMRFINPSLVVPLKGVWIADKTLRAETAIDLDTDPTDGAVSV